MDPFFRRFSGSRLDKDAIRFITVLQLLLIFFGGIKQLYWTTVVLNVITYSKSERTHALGRQTV